MEARCRPARAHPVLGWMLVVLALGHTAAPYLVRGFMATGGVRLAVVSTVRGVMLMPVRQQTLPGGAVSGGRPGSERCPACFLADLLTSSVASLDRVPAVVFARPPVLPVTSGALESAAPFWPLPIRAPPAPAASC